MANSQPCQHPCLASCTYDHAEDFSRRSSIDTGHFEVSHALISISTSRQEQASSDMAGSRTTAAALPQKLKATATVVSRRRN